MSDETPNGAAAPAEAADAGPTFTVEKMYVKDVSFEVPARRRCSTSRASPSCR